MPIMTFGLLAGGELATADICSSACPQRTNMLAHRRSRGGGRFEVVFMPWPLRAIFVGRRMPGVPNKLQYSMLC